MKFVRYGEKGSEKPGLLDAEGQIRALSPLFEDITVDMLSPESQAILAAIDVNKLPLVECASRLGPPVADIRQIITIGLNYVDHAEEADFPIPDYPLVFAKSIASLSGANDPIAVPASIERLDWEIELGFVIGKSGRHIAIEDALDHVAGYCTVIDVSERMWQFDRGGQLGKGKSYDNFTPMGPFLATADEILDPQGLDLWLDVNGELRQRGTTKQMIFPVAELIAHLSTYQTLLPGDLVITGTPAGVALGMNPPQWLTHGDRLTCGVSFLGEQSHDVVLEG